MGILGIRNQPESPHWFKGFFPWKVPFLTEIDWNWLARIQILILADGEFIQFTSFIHFSSHWQSQLVEFYQKDTWEFLNKIKSKPKKPNKKRVGEVYIEGPQWYGWDCKPNKVKTKISLRMKLFQLSWQSLQLGTNNILKMNFLQLH